MLETYVMASLALIIKPGPDLVCLLATALAEGRRRALNLMCGLILGCWLWILLLTAGVASFFSSHPAVVSAIQTAGAAYIAYLAFCSFADAFKGVRSGTVEPLRPAEGKGLRLFARGVLMAMSNPLTILFFLAFLPAFTRESPSVSPAFQTFLLGTLFCALVPLFHIPVVFACDFFRSKIVGSRKASLTLKFVSAAMLSAVAAVLASRLRF